MNIKSIGIYQVKSELGRGGMSTVYLAHDPRVDRLVAIKVLPREFMHDRKFLLRFEREAKIIAQLQHPTIVPVFDFGEEEGQPYLVMQYMPGGTLADRIAQNGQISLRETVEIISAIAPALDKAHSEGIIHRDLKPSNILFDEENRPYLSDFGIAKIAEGSDTLTGSRIIGTPAYMSPEQARSKEAIDSRSDVYALTAIAYEMLTGEQPFKADTPVGLIVAHINDPIPDLNKTRPGVPAGVQKVIKKGLAKERTERYALATDLSSALNRLVSEAEQSSHEALQIQEDRQNADDDRTYDDLSSQDNKVITKTAQGTNRISNLRRWIFALGGLVGVGLLIAGLVRGLPGTGSDQIALVPSPTPTATLTGDSPAMSGDVEKIPTPEPLQLITLTTTAPLTLMPTLGILTEMPDVMGLQLDEVVDVLVNSPVSVDYQFKFDNVTDPGVVIGQIPDPGDPISDAESVEVKLAFNLESVSSVVLPCPSVLFKRTEHRVSLQAGETYQVTVFSDNSPVTPYVGLDFPGGSQPPYKSSNGRNLQTYYIEETGSYIVSVGGTEGDGYNCNINVDRMIFPENMSLVETADSSSTNDSSSSDELQETTITISNALLEPIIVIVDGTTVSSLDANNDNAVSLPTLRLPVSPGGHTVQFCVTRSGATICGTIENVSLSQGGNTFVQASTYTDIGINAP